MSGMEQIEEKDVPVIPEVGEQVESNEVVTVQDDIKVDDGEHIEIDERHCADEISQGEGEGGDDTDVQENVDVGVTPETRQTCEGEEIDEKDIDNVDESAEPVEQETQETAYSEADIQEIMDDQQVEKQTDLDVDDDEEEAVENTEGATVSGIYDADKVPLESDSHRLPFSKEQEELENVKSAVRVDDIRRRFLASQEENKENGFHHEHNLEANNNRVKGSIAIFGSSSKQEKGMFKVVQTEKCAACQKTVYAMEKLEMNGHTYHKNCFKCSHCSARLTPKTFSMNEGIIYCVNHFKQLFARKGNYDEGFGRQQYKKKWDQGGKPEGATA